MSVLIPKFSISQIISNYRNKRYKTNSDFINQNFLNSSGQLSMQTTPISPHLVSINYLNSIIYDTGSGPISNGFNAIDLLYQNISNKTNAATNLFGNNSNIVDVNSFLNSTLNQQINYILTMIGISKISTISVAPFYSNLVNLIQSMCVALKSNNYNRQYYLQTALSLTADCCKYLITTGNY